MAVTWKSVLQGTAGIAVTLLVLIVCLAYFAVGLATRSHPAAHEVTTAVVSDTVRIYRNSFGIPHIVSSTDTDLVYAQGYVHAQDRLWQMDVWRRTAQGRLAEIFGSDMAPTDAFLRCLDLRHIVREQYKAMSPHSRLLLQAYSKGVEDYISNNAERLAFEFDALGYHPESWTPEDCLLVGRMLALHQSPALWNDLVYTQIARQRGLDAMRLYIPQSPGAPYVFGSDSTTPSVYVPVPFPDTTVNYSEPVAQLMGALQEVQGHIGLPNTLHASNCWAVGRGADGAILANDPHMAVGMPARWYQIHLTSPSMNVVGLSIPGIPFVLSGRNDSLAWGVTSAMVDDVDYAVERVDRKNDNFYLEANGQRVKFRFRRDTIHIKNGPDSLIDLRYTSRGCVISDAHPLRKQTQLIKTGALPVAELLSQTCLVMRWTGQVNSDEISALYQINSAANIPALQRAASLWGVPAFVLNVASHTGEVGTIGMGYIPNRKNVDVLLPHPAWDAGRGWNGVLRLSDLPPIIKRTPGFVASANNRLTATGAPSQSILWEPASRINRISDQLKVYRSMSVRDAQVLQQDVKSPYALEFTKVVLPVIKRARKRYNQTELAALSTLEHWDGSMTAVSPAASIHAVFLQHMMRNTFEDELGLPLYNLWVYLGSVPTRRMIEILDEPLNPLFDDVRTPTRENLSWIVVRSFMETVKELSSRFATASVNSWTWGTLHQVSFPHPMGIHPLMRPVVDVGPYEVGGSSTTVFNTEWGIQDPFAVRNTASARVISDFADSVLYSVLPGGISGQALEGHYADQMQLWLKGGYVRIPVSSKPDVTFRLFHELVPASVALLDS